MKQLLSGWRDSFCSKTDVQKLKSATNEIRCSKELIRPIGFFEIRTTANSITFYIKGLVTAEDTALEDA